MIKYIVAYSIIVFFIAAATVTMALLYIRAQKSKINEKSRGADMLSESERAFVDVFCRESQMAFLLLDAEMRSPLYISPAVSRFFGIPAQKLSLDLSVIEKAVGKKAFRRFLREYDAMAENEESEFTYEFSYGDGKTAEVQAARVRRGGKSYDAFTVYDVSERSDEQKKLREDLVSARAQAEGKLSFLASMSHEIRTPMNGIMGMMSLARMNIDNHEKAKEYLDRAGDLSAFLLGMINDILDISKIESGKMVLYNTAFDIGRFAEKIKNMFNGMVTGKGIEFNVETVDFTSPYLISDEMRLTQVVTNFVSNANKFTPPGGRIDVTFKQLGTIGGKTQILIRVRDTGKGIAPENIRKIMKPFEQEEASTAHNYGGTGLGLAICDQIVTLMGGSIVVDSELGKGSDFNVFLTLDTAAEKDVAKVEDETAPKNTAFTFEGCRILLAEDNEVNAEIAIEILESEGAVVTHARDGQEVVDIFTERDENSFDLILMDIQMPKRNGREATKAIRASGRADAESVVIIALSADAFVEDVMLSKNAGMDGHVAKPVDFDALKIEAGNAIAAKSKGAERT